MFHNEFKSEDIQESQGVDIKSSLILLKSALWYSQIFLQEFLTLRIEEGEGKEIDTVIELWSDDETGGRIEKKDWREDGIKTRSIIEGTSEGEKWVGSEMICLREK